MLPLHKEPDVIFATIVLNLKLVQTATSHWQSKGCARNIELFQSRANARCAKNLQTTTFTSCRIAESEKVRLLTLETLTISDAYKRLVVFLIALKLLITDITGAVYDHSLDLT